MTPVQIKVAWYAGIGILLWWLRARAVPAPARVTRTIDIDANVGSSTFGEMYSPDVQAAIDRSNAAIAAFDRANPENEATLRGLGP